MSRIGKQPIVLPHKVKAVINGGQLQVEGPLGKLSMALPPFVSIQGDGKQLVVKRENEERNARSTHGLSRARVAGMVEGVTQGFKRELDLSGVGYRAEVKGKELQMAVGFSHAALYPLPEGIKATVEKQTHLTLTGIDKQLIGQVASEIRKSKPRKPYRGKGGKFTEETIRRKAGKAATGAGAKGKEECL